MIGCPLPTAYYLGNDVLNWAQGLIGDHGLLGINCRDVVNATPKVFGALVVD
jgi:hypothetical protein